MPPFKNNSLSRVIILVLFIESVAIFLYLGFFVYKLLFFKKVLKGIKVLSGETILVSDINKTGFRIIISIVISGIVLFLLWLYRLYRNIESVRSTETGFTPFSRILALAIPFANLFIPNTVIHEICNAYTTDIREMRCIKRVINKWRFLLAVIIAYSLYCIFMFYVPASVNEVINGIYYKIFLLILCIHFSFITMGVIELMNEMEKKKGLLFSHRLA
ncbi:MAG: DUF4328 domain-containing protein [Panacibacter sp.]